MLTEPAFDSGYESSVALKGTSFCASTCSALNIVEVLIRAIHLTR